MLTYIVFTYYVINFYHHSILVNLNCNNYTENDGTCVLLRMPSLVKSYSFCVLYCLDIKILNCGIFYQLSRTMLCHFVADRIFEFMLLCPTTKNVLPTV